MFPTGSIALDIENNQASTDNRTKDCGLNAASTKHKEFYKNKALVGLVEISKNEEAEPNSVLKVESEDLESKNKVAIDELFNQNLALEGRVHRMELLEIFNEHIGALANKEILDGIFQKSEEDGDGTVEIEAVSSYINNIRPQTKKERTKFRSSQLSKSASLWCVFLIAVGAAANGATNLRDRWYGDLHGKNHYNYQVGAWLFLVACSFPVFLYYENERKLHKHRALMRKKIATSIKCGLQRSSKEKAAEVSYAPTPPGSTDGTQGESKSPGSEFGQLDIEDPILDITHLRLILETLGVFLVQDELEYIFHEIGGTNMQTERLSLKDLTDFANEPSENTSSSQERVIILCLCIQNAGFWTSIFFSVGSILFVLVDYIDGTAATHVLGLGATLYAMGAFCSLINVCNSERAIHESMCRVDAQMRAIAVKLGMVVSCFNEEIIERSDVGIFNEEHISWFSADQIEAFHEKGADDLFKAINNNDDLSEIDLYNAFVELGMHTSIENFQRLFKNFTISEDNKVHCSIVSQYIKRIKPEVSKGIIYWRILTTMPKNVSFWLVLVQIVAASCTIWAIYHPFQDENDTSSSQNLFLAGSLGWFSTACYVLLEAWKAAGAMFDQLEESKLVLKEAVLRTAKEAQNKNSENCLGCTTTSVGTAITKRRQDQACKQSSLINDRVSRRSLLTSLSSSLSDMQDSIDLVSPCIVTTEAA